jgi:hypothetical protein
MDFLDFRVGSQIFLFISAINEKRDQPALCRIFKLVQEPELRLDPKPIFSKLYFHARNVAVMQSTDQSAWFWVADHGIDIRPFPGGHSPLFQIFADGSVIEYKTPLLEIDQFSFDGCIWSHPQDGSTWLFQCNIGRNPPRLLRWVNHPQDMTDESFLLPQVLQDQSRRFLVSRVLEASEKRIVIYLGNDDSLENPVQSFPKDALLEISWCSDEHTRNLKVQINEDVLPDRPRDPSWSTVEFLRRSDLWLLLTHNRGWSEGAAAVYKVCFKDQSFYRIQIRDFPDLATTKHWVARAAISPSARSIILYLRNAAGTPIQGSTNNTLWLQNSSTTDQLFKSNKAEFGSGYYVGGFFLTDDVCVLLDSYGRVLAFRSIDLSWLSWIQSFLSRRRKTF